MTLAHTFTHWTARAALVLGAVSLSGCGYNDFQRLDEQVNAGWSEVLNQYQRRSDLIPNIVATVKGEANFEQETLTKVVEARAKATSIQATPELVNNPEAFAKFQAAQGEVTSASPSTQGLQHRHGLRQAVLCAAQGLMKRVHGRCGLEARIDRPHLLPRGYHAPANG